MPHNTDGSFKKPIPVLYEDDCYIVFNKPAGLLVIPTPRDEKNTLVNIVNFQYASGAQAEKLHPCHRLDRETSGAIIFSKGKRHQKMMMDIFKQRLVEKKYIAFAHGRMRPKKGSLRGYVQDFDQKKHDRFAKGKLSLTHYQVIEEKNLFSVLEVSPVTGRTNQIRIQLSDIGHPLLGERKYAVAREFPLKFRRVALHAYSLAWQHPVTHKHIRVKSDLPEDMEAFIARN